jgi:hypothetical protein
MAEMMYWKSIIALAPLEVCLTSLARGKKTKFLEIVGSCAGGRERMQSSGGVLWCEGFDASHGEELKRRLRISAWNKVCECGTDERWVRQCTGFCDAG